MLIRFREFSRELDEKWDRDGVAEVLLDWFSRTVITWTPVGTVSGFVEVLSLSLAAEMAAGLVVAVVALEAVSW